MKTTNRLLILITIVLFSLSITSCKCKKDDISKKERTITLYVDTENIKKPNSNNYCNFGQTDGSSNEDYTIKVKVGDEITWEGVSTSDPKNDKVNIVLIKYKKGTKVFKKDSINGKKKVTGKVLYDTENKADYKYEIKFTVIRNGKEKKFKIDPKLMVSKR